jgi:DNA-binding response OmpR family regulator
MGFSILLFQSLPVSQSQPILFLNLLYETETENEKEVTIMLFFNEHSEILQSREHIFKRFWCYFFRDTMDNLRICLLGLFGGESIHSNQRS